MENCKPKQSKPYKEDSKNSEEPNKKVEVIHSDKDMINQEGFS